MWIKVQFSTLLSVNVLKKEVIFASESPVIKITVAETAVDNFANTHLASSSQDKEEVKGRRKPGGGRKRSAAKLDDDQLVKRLKMGETITRNERQMKMLEDLNQGMSHLSYCFIGPNARPAWTSEFCGLSFASTPLSKEF